jgi:aminoglycoside 2'-N-acetyltransferase I
MPSALTIEHVPSAHLSAEVAATVWRLCDAAYGCPTQHMFRELGAGEHLLGRSGGVLVSHLMWVTRWLQPEGRTALRTAYVEMVATHPAEQGRGHATQLLEHLPLYLGEYDLAALCPATEGLYHLVGWRCWQGPLFARKEGRLIPTPEERVMVLSLPRTPALSLDVPFSVEWRPGEVW